MTTKIKSGVIAAGAVDASALSDNSITIAHLNCSDGTNGQVLSTDGSGTLSFTDMTGGVDGIVSSADATAITINSSENVGIGTSNPNSKLHVSNGSAGIQLSPDGISDGISFLQAYDWVAQTYDGLRYYANEHYFYTGNNERMRIASNGDVQLQGGNQMTNALSWYNSIGPYELASIENVSHPSYNDSGGLVFKTAGLSNSGMAERMRIDSSGVVYFGPNGSTADPRINRHPSNGYDYINSGDSRWLKVGASSGHTNVAFQDGSSGITIFETAGTERMRIGSSGGITISNSPANTGEAIAQPDMSKTTEGGIHFTTGGTQTSKGITWEAGGSGETQAGIVCHNNDSDGTHLGFFTTYTYAGGPYCQMKISNYGAIIAGVNVDVGSVSAPSNTTFYSTNGDITVQADNGAHYISDLLPGYNRGQFGCMAANGSYMYFAVNGYYAAYLTSSGTLSASDERLKENVTTLTGSLDKINQLRGVSFNWKNEARGTGNNIGFIAQEVESVYPELVGDGGLPDVDGESPHKHVNYEKLVPALVEAIKELKTELDAAKARIETLEG